MGKMNGLYALNFPKNAFENNPVEKRHIVGVFFA